jgi:5'-3' exonuclease
LAPDPLLIADVPWLLYRAFFSLPKSILGSDGQPVNALLGTVNALLNAAAACRPRALVACFGAEQARYRVELYPPYHAHRDPMPAELRTQWERAPDLLASFGWTVCDAAGSDVGELEADDAMGSYAHVETAVASSGRALLLSGDRDMYQAVSERTAVLEMKRGVSSEVGPAQVRERYSVEPAQVPDFIALRGDPSDGLPGAPGIGAKTAAELLRAYGSLEALLTAAADPGAARRPRKAATLLAHAEQLRSFKRIATLVEIDVPRPADTPTDFSGGAQAAVQLGMKGLGKRLEDAHAHGTYVPAAGAGRISSV